MKVKSSLLLRLHQANTTRPGYSNPSSGQFIFPIGNNNDSNTIRNIYFIRIRGTNMVKIGYTTQDVKHRLSQLQVSNPTQLDVEFLFATPDFCRIEHQLHLLMAKERIRGEWFYIKLGFDYEGLIKQV